MSTWCILLSGGNGLRMGTQSNKTLISLLGEPALCRACARCADMRTA